ncbi:MAG: NUDIX domain-containing protein [Bacteroidota bacterium]
MERTPTIQLAVDAVVFGYSPGKGISVLLIQRKYEPFQERWALPGGFVKEAESLEEAVERELSEETGVTINYLEQLYTFGKPGRDPRQRVVSVAYFVLIRPDAFQLHADTDAKDAQWFDIEELPDLAFDHQTIVDEAIQRLRGKVTYEPIGFELLEEKFPFSDLQALYETLLLRKVDRRNFQKKIKNLGILQGLKETRKPVGSGRPAQLFRFDKDKYFQLKTQGTLFEVWL